MNRIFAKHVALLLATLSMHLSFPSELRWNWDAINLSDISFPKDFVWGTAVCEYQTSGNRSSIGEWYPETNWSAFEKAGKVPAAESACQSWERMEDDITCLKQLGVKAYRFSVDWAMIEPQHGVIDQKAIEHYKVLCKRLLEEGIRPMVTLHHFVHPQWFQDLGSFEREENNKYFIDFAELVYNELHEYVDFWCTINEPTVYALMGYILGDFPPAQKANFQMAGTVVKNMLKAHVAIYHTLKSLPGGDASTIGFAHSYLVFEPYNSWNPISRITASIFTLLNESTINYFKNGEFNYRLMGFANVTDSENSAKVLSSLDYMGINYYAHVFVGTYKEEYRACDIPTDMPYAIYAEGLYRAVKHVAQLKVPMYITENGIADGKDDRREIWIKRYLYALSQVMKEGYDVRGYFYWSMIDNYEWNRGWEPKFGLFEVDLKTQKRTLRKGAECFASLLNNGCYDVVAPEKVGIAVNPVVTTEPVVIV